MSPLPSDTAARRALILAAGLGSRLRTANGGPKALVEIHGRSILERALAALEAHGTRQITVVIGHEGDRIAEHLAARGRGAAIELVRNPEFATTDSAYSLWCARGALADGAVVLNGDVVFADRILAATIPTRSDHSTWLATRAQPDDDGWMLALGPDRRVIGLEAVRSGTRTVDGTRFKSAGILSLSARTGRRLAAWLDTAVHEGRADCHFDEILRRHLAALDLEGVEIDRASWAEIDDAADLARARRVFAPARPRDGGGTDA